MKVYFLNDFQNNRANFSEAAISDRLGSLKKNAIGRINNLKSQVKNRFPGQSTSSKKRSLRDKAFGTTTQGRVARGIAAAGAIGAGAMLLRAKPRLIGAVAQKATNSAKSAGAEVARTVDVTLRSPVVAKTAKSAGTAVAKTVKSAGTAVKKASPRRNYPQIPDPWKD